MRKICSDSRDQLCLPRSINSRNLSFMPVGNAASSASMSSAVRAPLVADRCFLLPTIRKIIPSTLVIGRRIINWLGEGRSANSIAFGGHALGINCVIPSLQRATGNITIACSNCTTRNQTGAGAQCRSRSHISRHRTECSPCDRAESGADGGLLHSAEVCSSAVCIPTAFTRCK
jgi:hypothetical protein